MLKSNYFIFVITVALVQDIFSQGTVEGIILSNTKPVPGVHLELERTPFETITGENGKYKITGVPAGNYHLELECVGCKHDEKKIKVENNKTTVVDFDVRYTPKVLDEVVITSGENKSVGLKHLKSVDDGGIYAGKKNEVIDMDDVSGNKAANTSRQIFSKVAGMNIWESDGAGIQLGIGGRGLNPSRVSNFNTRQNGYDMSADALGYPESYYTPPSEGLERIEIVRGAASLQYGTQFGGIINFKMKKGNPDKPLELVSRQTLGSFGFLNTFNSIGGTKKKISYYAFYQHKQGKGWRENSGFNVDVAYGAVNYRFSEKFNLSSEYTFMNYLARQAGGLTDAQFRDGARQSIRNRNWFKVNWNLAAVVANYEMNSRLKFNNRLFGLMAGRSALGVLDAPNKSDFMQERHLWLDQYRNWGDEFRTIYHYFTYKNPSTLLVGARYYNGSTDRTQGLSNDGITGYRSDFSFVKNKKEESAEYNFPGSNAAVFAENIFQLTPKWNITPGIRYEYISTKADGYYTLINRDLAGNIIYQENIKTAQENNRDFILTGLGTSYRPNDKLEYYINFSRNYRAITFNDIIVPNPNVVVDENLTDEKGYTADGGIRGSIPDLFNYDISVFILSYANRIGSVLKADPATYNTYRYRTNISASRNLGIETFGELDFLKLIKKPENSKLLIFSTFSMIDARYIQSDEPAINNKKVEMVPDYLLRSGITFRKKTLSATFQHSYTSEQYTDATNAVFTSNAINGIVPAYHVMDVSVEYSYKVLTASAGINNLANNMYFTRRADGYPGPGIIPSDGRSCYITLQVKL